jgi:hypothetical protein
MIQLEKKDQRKIGLDRAADDRKVMEFVGNLGCVFPWPERGGAGL